MPRHRQTYRKPTVQVDDIVHDALKSPELTRLYINYYRRLFGAAQVLYDHCTFLANHNPKSSRDDDVVWRTKLELKKYKDNLNTITRLHQVEIDEAHGRLNNQPDHEGDK